jgi:hypothetical protein
VHPDPWQRYTELSALVFDLRHPSRKFLSHARPPLLDRDPVKFWKSVSVVLVLIIAWLLRQLNP